jgi:hypothetical protein
MSDLHLDSGLTDVDLILHELDVAAEAGDRVLMGGDVFDLILPADRRRYEPSAIRANLRGRSDVVNAAVEWATELLTPYASIIDGIGVGNHEAAAVKAQSVDAVRLLVERLNYVRDRGLRPIAELGYTSYVDYRVLVDTKRRAVGRYVIWYTHGAGKVRTTASALNGLVAKSAVFAADLYWTGHSHARAHCTEVMIHCGRRGVVETRDVKCVVTGSYMVPYGNQTQDDMARHGRQSNYVSEGALAPHGLGGARVVLRWTAPGFPSDVKVIQ